MHKVASKVPTWTPYAVLVLAAAICLILFVLKGSFPPKDLAPGLFALFGTFLGALLAFRLEESRERDREVRRRKAALNRALLVLNVHYNGIQNWLKLIMPFKNDPARAFNMTASQPPEEIVMRQQFDELVFLLESSNPQLLLELIVEQERFAQAMLAVKERNRLYVDKVQPAIAEQGLNGQVVSASDVERRVGEYLFGAAKLAADQVFSHIEASNESIPEVGAKLHKIAKEIYPEDKFVRVTKLPPILCDSKVV